MSPIQGTDFPGSFVGTLPLPSLAMVQEGDSVWIDMERGIIGPLMVGVGSDDGHF